MSCSPARLAANKANSLKSKGPVTDQGKAKSRLNSLKHGLTAETLRTPEEQAAILANPSLKTWLEGELVVITQRITRVHQSEELERDRAALRAATCWNDDRRHEADRLARGLSKAPERVVSRLGLTVQGCDWLIERWEWLRDAVGTEGKPTAEQRQYASDLRGIPVFMRSEGGEAGDLVALADREIAALATKRERMRAADAFDCETTKLKLSDDATAELRRLIRYEAALHRRLRWCMEQTGLAKPAVPLAKVSSVPPRQPVATVPPPPKPEPLPMDLDLDRLPTWGPPLPGSSLGFSMVPTSTQPVARPRPRLR